MKKGEISTSASFKNGQELMEFMQENRSIRRWYLARAYSENVEKSYVDLYYSPISNLGKQVLTELDESTLLTQPADDFDWWQPENFDRPAHIPLVDFRKLLQEHSHYRSDQPVEEGMVFIEIWCGDEMSLIPFSYQAREASKNVYQRLLGKGSVTGKMGEEK